VKTLKNVKIFSLTNSYFSFYFDMKANITDVVKQLQEEEARLQKVTEEICAAPSARSNFSLVAHPEKEELILYGGEFFNGQKAVVYNDLYFYNIPKNEWKNVRSPGPTARSSHQMVSLANDGGQLWVNKNSVIL